MNIENLQHIRIERECKYILTFPQPNSTHRVFLFLTFYAAVRNADREARGASAAGIEGRTSCRYNGIGTHVIIQFYLKITDG